MASVNVGGSLDYLFFASGSDSLPSNGVSQSYKLFGVLDTNGTGVQKFADRRSRPSTAPAATRRPSTLPGGGRRHRLLLDHDVPADRAVHGADREPVRADVPRRRGVRHEQQRQRDGHRLGARSGPGATGRATAPFVVDQHLVFASGGKVEILGDPRDYNNGFGQVGVRILSWRPRR